MRAGPSPSVLLLSAVGTRTNPYLGLLRDGLARAGATVLLGADLSGVRRAGPGAPDVVHVHWLEAYHVLPPPARGGALARRASAIEPVYQLRLRRRLETLLDELEDFRQAGGTVAYTIHNVEPHEDAGAAGRRAVARLVQLADVVHVHDRSAAREMADRFGRTIGVTLAPHGHYIDSYPNTMPVEAARRALGLPQSGHVFASMGLLRPYKGLEELIPAFRAGAPPDAALVIAGKPAAPGYANRLAALADGDPRITIAPRFVPAEEVQVILNAADTAVLPYREVTSSGAAMLALSFGLPVVAPLLGAFPDLVGGTRGILYEPRDARGLAGALAAAAARGPTNGELRSEIIAWTRRFDWAATGRTLLAAYVAARGGARV